MRLIPKKETATIGVMVTRKISNLIEEEIIAGNFPSKSSFIRYLIFKWLEKNRSEKFKEDYPIDSTRPYQFSHNKRT